jgi:hypothetical protein
MWVLGFMATIDYVIVWGNVNEDHTWNPLYEDGIKVDIC